MWLLAGLIVAVTAAPISSGAAGEGASPLVQYFDFEVRPSTQLSRTEPTPVWMETTGRYRNGDGSHVPPVKELRFQADRHLALDLKGVPGCGGPGIHSDVRRSPGEMEDLCRESIVGRGEVTFEVEFPDQPKEKARGRSILVKADGSAKIDLAVHMFITAPVTAEISIPIDIRRVDKGRIGWEAKLLFPKIAGGYGSLIDYSLRIGKPFLSATCVGRQLELRAITLFADGTSRSERAIRTCAVAKADVRK